MPIVIFPEGTRSHTGELGHWKRAGLRILLEARSWEVYVVAADGLWQSRRFVDFVKNVSLVHCRMAAVGPFQSPSPGEDVEAFIDQMRARMEETLQGIRTSSAA